MTRSRIIISAVAVLGLATTFVVYLLTKDKEGDIVDSDLVITAVTVPTQIQLPLDRYRQSTAAWRTFETAVFMVGIDCMKQKGFEWKVPVRNPPPDEEGPNSRRYGLLDLGHAQRWGYHRNPAEEQYVQTMKSYSRNLPDAAAKAWLGPLDAKGNPTGCYRTAADSLGGFAPRDMEQFVQGLFGSSGASSRNHPKVAAAMQGWRTCMASSGYQYETPFTVGDGTSWTEASATTDEITVATADVKCNHSTNLAGIWLAVETAYQKRLIDENAERLAEMQEWLETSAGNALKVLSTK